MKFQKQPVGIQTVTDCENGTEIHKAVITLPTRELVLLVRDQIASLGDELLAERPALRGIGVSLTDREARA